MDRIPGVIPRSEWPADVPLSAEQARELCLHAVDVLAELHGIDPAAAGLTDLGKGDGYVRRQVDGWSTRYRNARTDDVPDLETVMAWLDAHQPDDVATCVIHNDFKLDNLVLAEDDVTRVVGVLDWEMATVGDPLMDLGGTMAYWVQDDDDEFFRQFRRQPTNLPGMLSRDEVVAYYCERTGHSVTPEQWQFYEVYGLFRLGVIAQQIYYRFFHGQTSNEAYQRFGPAAQYLEARCNQIIGAS
jgi:aminoglycoside phosphotransferase (APT) family kinase protein